MKTRAIRVLVVAFSLTAVGLLALSPSRAADAAAPAADPMGGCCGAQPPVEETPPVTQRSFTCGEGTHLKVSDIGTASEKRTCVRD